MPLFFSLINRTNRTLLKVKVNGTVRRNYRPIIRGTVTKKTIEQNNTSLLIYNQVIITISWEINIIIGPYGCSGHIREIDGCASERTDVFTYEWKRHNINVLLRSANWLVYVKFVLLRICWICSKNIIFR